MSDFIQYPVNIPDVAQSYLGAYQAAAGVRQNQLALEAEKTEQERQKEIGIRISKLLQPGATAEDYKNAMVLLPKDRADALKQAYEMMDGSQQQAALSQIGPIYYALRSGNTGTAVSLIDDQIEAAENSGDREGAKLLRAYREAIGKGDVGAKSAELFFGLTLSSLPGGDKIITSASTLSEEERKDAKEGRDRTEFVKLMRLKDLEIAKATTQQEVDEINRKYAEPLKRADLLQKQAEAKKTASTAAIESVKARGALKDQAIGQRKAEAEAQKAEAEAGTAVEMQKATLRKTLAEAGWTEARIDETIASTFGKRSETAAAEEKRPFELRSAAAKATTDEAGATEAGARAETARERSAVELKQKYLDLGFTEAQTTKVLVETRKLGLDAEKIATEIEQMKEKLDRLPASGEPLSPDAEKRINDGIEQSAISTSLSGQYRSLADEFDKEISASGTAAKAQEWVKKVMGTQDAPTALRQEYLRLRNTAVLKMLPPGVASDKDVELALMAFPGEDSNPQLISSFLRGMAKMQQYDAFFNRTKAEWIQQNGSLGPALRDMDVGGAMIKKGERFDEYMRTALPDVKLASPPAQEPARGEPTSGEVDISDLKAFLKTNNPGKEATIDSFTTVEGLKNAYPRGWNAYISRQPAPQTGEVRTGGYGGGIPD